jgi:hypothetical protein
MTGEEEAARPSVEEKKNVSRKSPMRAAANAEAAFNSSSFSQIDVSIALVTRSRLLIRASDADGGTDLSGVEHPGAYAPAA